MGDSEITNYNYTSVTKLLNLNTYSYCLLFFYMFSCRHTLNSKIHQLLAHLEQIICEFRRLKRRGRWFG